MFYNKSRPKNDHVGAKRSIGALKSRLLKTHYLDQYFELRVVTHNFVVYHGKSLLLG